MHINKKKLYLYYSKTILSIWLFNIAFPIRDALRVKKINCFKYGLFNIFVFYTQKNYTFTLESKNNDYLR
jgi:hypothetical protein